MSVVAAGRVEGRRVQGFAVSEALLALLLGWGLVCVALSVAVAQRRLAATLSAGSDWLATRRMARQVLGEEARRAGGAAAWRTSADTISLRAYRGYAYVCPEGLPSAEVLVRAWGDRRADPAKDSVTLLAGDGSTRTLALISRAPEPGGCSAAAPGPVERWHLAGEVPAGTVLARFFERGSYHLAARALRYRQGAGGRQPLTPENLAAPPSVFVADPRWVRARLFRWEDGPGAVGDSLVILLRWSSPHG